MMSTKLNWNFDFKSMLLIGAFLIIARGSVLLRDVYLASRFGVDGIVDAFNISLTLVSWPANIIVSIITVVIIPIIIDLSTQNKVGERDQLIRELNFTVVSLSFLVLVFIVVFSAPLSDFFTSSLLADTKAQTLRMTRWFAILAFLTIIAGYFAVRLQALRNSTFTLVEGFPALALIGSFVFLERLIDDESVTIIFGVLMGALLQCAVLIWLIRRNGERIGSPKARHTSPHWRGIYNAIGIMVLSQVVLGFTIPIDQYFLAQLGDGEVARYGYATRVVGIVMMMGTTMVSRVLLPSFSDSIGRGDLAAARKYALKWSLALFFTGLIGCIFAQQYAGVIVALLFERGNFSSSDTLEIAFLVKILIFQVPFFLSGQVFVQWFSANRNYKILLTAGCFATLVKCTMLFVFYKNLDVNIVMYSVLAIYISTFFVLLFEFLKTDNFGKMASIE